MDYSASNVILGLSTKTYYLDEMKNTRVQKPKLLPREQQQHRTKLDEGTGAEEEGLKKDLLSSANRDGRHCSRDIHSLLPFPVLFLPAVYSLDRTPMATGVTYRLCHGCKRKKTELIFTK